MTEIKYELPENVKDAVIYFYEASGKMIKKVELEKSGKGNLVVHGSKLSEGVYIYTLVAGGKIIESKRMVKQ